MILGIAKATWRATHWKISTGESFFVDADGKVRPRLQWSSQKIFKADGDYLITFSVTRQFEQPGYSQGILQLRPIDRKAVVPGGQTFSGIFCESDGGHHTRSIYAEILKGNSYSSLEELVGFVLQPKPFSKLCKVASETASNPITE